MDLTQITIVEAACLLRKKEISPVELTQAHLERIEQRNPELNAFITVTAETALDEARRTEIEIQTTGPRSLLHGIPLALKDLYETRGTRTTAGSKFFSDYVPDQDASTVSRLKEAGAVFLGKLNMHEIALGVTNDNPHFGAAHNPWDLSRATGGSSGGSAAALVSGMCMGSLGSDTGGSIRIPSSLCGTVGLKPTYGRVSLRGVIPLSWSLDHAGPMARTVMDAAVLLQAIAGYDPQDPSSADMPVDDFTGSLEDGVSGWRCALAAGDAFEGIDPEVDEIVRKAGQALADAGARVDAPPDLDFKEAVTANGMIAVVDAAAFHRERLGSHPEDFGADVRRRLEIGRDTTVEDYALARRKQVELRRRYEQLFETYDLLLTPATPGPAPLLEGPDAVEQARLLTRCTAPFNLTGLPALVIPGGFSSAGLPIGVQIVGAPWQERKVLQAGRALEKILQYKGLAP
jgi:aspartyl-tRNA(Asn)/glutamyl-tRNA(Gln) amidotransferase subunit A